MFCTQCGTQVDEGQKFCKNCGASLAKPSQVAPNLAAPDPEPITSPSPMETAPRPRPAQPFASQTRPIPISPSREGRGISKSVIAGAGVAVIVIAVAGLYFGTDLIHKSVSETPPAATEPMAKVDEPLPVAPVEVAKVDSLPADSDLNSPLWSSMPSEAPAPQEAPKPKPEPLSKPAPKAEPVAETRRSPSQPSAESSRAGERGNKAPGPAAASRRPVSPGTYETIRPTTVFEQPSGSSRVVANIGGSIKVNVVGSTGDWLEVRSRAGNPPGFIRRDDAIPAERTD